jgi:SAM-dependent methyltransferase
VSGRPDTAARSLEHWSEAGRRSMDGFYALASEDYRRLEAARDWAADLRGRADAAGRVRLLDVACGSGRFPAALLAAGLAARTAGLDVAVDLLDPSPFSLAEARRVLAAPFRAAGELQTGIEELAPPAEPYDVAWATHALYAVPPALLGEGVRRMHRALAPGGLGAVGQATSRSHYLRVYDAYRASHAPGATPYTSAEEVGSALRAQGAEPSVRAIAYETGTADAQTAELFLQRCLFDDTLSLARMCAPGPHGDELAEYLAGCRDGDRWTFAHEVHLITWTPPR